MARKQLKLTDLFSFRQVSTKSVKRQLTDDNLSMDGPSEVKKRTISTSPDAKISGLIADSIGDGNNNGLFAGSEKDEETSTKMKPMPLMASPQFVLHPFLATLTEPSWRSLLDKEFRREYVKGICRFLEEQDKKSLTVFPPRHLIFNAFNLTPAERVAVVIIGQDPYHNMRQAHGLCFSVPDGQPMPPSLKNIFKELSSEYASFKIPEHGNLTKWATQGVFLLNATLTVEAHKANSHSNIGWQQFTDAVIKLISDRSERGIVFLLWGGFAHKKEALIDKRKHRIIKTAHPSPLSAYRFFGCKCFSRTNEALVELRREPIDWNTL